MTDFAKPTTPGEALRASAKSLDWFAGEHDHKAVQSHRYFEIVPAPFQMMPPCHHQAGDASRDHGAKQTESAFRDAIGCDWMTVHEARQAIPPAYTEWLGAHLMAAVTDNPHYAGQESL